MYTVCTGHVMLVDALYITVDFFKNNITGESFMRICGELLQTGWIRPRLLLGFVLWYQSTYLCINYHFTTMAEHLAPGKQNSPSLTTVTQTGKASFWWSFPAFEATNEAKSRSCLFFFFISFPKWPRPQADLKHRSVNKTEKTLERRSFDIAAAFWIIKHSRIVNLGVLVTPSRTFLQKLISADISWYSPVVLLSFKFKVSHDWLSRG